MSWSVRQLRRVRRRRWLCGCGGLALACSFFMPMFPVCDSPMVPSAQWVELFTDSPPRIGDLSGTFVLFGVPYLYGLLTCLMAFRSRAIRRRSERSMGISAAILFGVLIVVIVSGLALSNGLWPPNLLDLSALMLTLLVLFSLAYYLRTLRMGPSGLLCTRWYFALCCTAWFVYVWVSVDERHYGLGVSLAGAACILWACTAEAQIRCHLTWGGTLRRLACCRIELFDLDGPRCFGCGYLLLGLGHRRCPECGRPYDPDDYAVDPAQPMTPADAGVG